MHLLLRTLRKKKKETKQPFFVQLDTLLTTEQLNQPLQLIDFYKPIGL